MVGNVSDAIFPFRPSATAIHMRRGETILILPLPFITNTTNDVRYLIVRWTVVHPQIPSDKDRWV